ncbi:hypothetical protein [Sphingomonas mali]|uniref:hypothetical protein n=1 Tax=Sphingomonas mali TaxID=40682 RepID=UPI0012EDB093|nr:hypothetical protein [Sphingomonas mali]
MRRKPGISLYHPPARKPTVMRRYGAFAGIGLLVGAVAGLGLTQMPVGQVAAVTSTVDKGCVQPRRADDAKRCDVRHSASHCAPKPRCDRDHGAGEPRSTHP